jgi:pimeloyl-ACP methyl ester carboxylesterase
MMNIRVGTLAVDKVTAEYKKYNYPLLFVHGAGGTTEYLKNYLDFFSRAGWDCYALNLRGHGASDPDPKLAFLKIEDYVDDVNKVRTTLGIEDCVLIGHSMGGLISQKTAEGADKIKGLVLIASAPPKGVKLEFKKDFLLVKIIARGIWYTVRRKPLSPNFPITAKLALNNIPLKDQMTAYKMLGPESLAVGSQVGKGYRINPDKIRCPKLVIGCKQDNIAMESMEEKLARFLKADKYIAYGQFGHMIMIEKGWEKSAEDIKNWLSSTVKNWS